MASVNSNNRIFHGIGASPGIIIGEARIADRSRVSVVETPIAPAEIPSEIERFQKALEEAKDELRALKEEIAGSRGIEHLYVIDTHLLILEDTMLVSETIS